MERLTKRTEHGDPVFVDGPDVCPDEVCERLAAYEDISLNLDLISELTKAYKDGRVAVAEYPIAKLYDEVCALRRYKEYFDNLYNNGLEVANWHLNGDTEPLDSFIDSAEAAMKEAH